MELTTPAFDDGQPIPGDYAFCLPDPDTHATLGPNRNPAFMWSDVPEGAESLVLICHDPVVPTSGEDVNQEGREVPADLARTDFFHWILVDISPDQPDLDEGEFSDRVTPRGKDGPVGPRGTRQGVNDYTGWFAGDTDMSGTYFGYDGPCPPWNDSLVHQYVFTLYALDVDRCPVEGNFNGADVRAAMEGHVLAQASVTGTYTLNPRLTA
ncbi:MAG: YbhB/YbcL family Raf kinase inhibitor-like protein [Acidimicrobiia bacterium]|nr:YbhB/YbcL family Raf kinase inhibitor-like protein [Acidimicrobiia bacterium]